MCSEYDYPEPAEIKLLLQAANQMLQPAQALLSIINLYAVRFNYF